MAQNESSINILAIKKQFHQVKIHKSEKWHEKTTPYLAMEAFCENKSKN